MKYLIFIFLVVSSMLANGKDKEYIRISNGEIQVAIDLDVGGRVMEYSRNGNNVIYVRSANNRENSEFCRFCGISLNKL